MSGAALAASPVPRAYFGEQRIEACAIAELDAGGVAPVRLIEIARQRNFCIARVAGARHPALRPAQNLFDRHAFVGGDRNERGVGAVFQKPPHQIGEQIAMAADRRVDAARGIRQLGQKRGVERLAHAVQALEFEALDAARVLDDAGDGQRVVGGELRVKPSARREQLPGAGHVAEVGHGLAREHRIIGKPALLRALDLGVPIGALDQPDRQPAAQRRGGLLEPVDHGQRALLIGLHRKPKSVPAAQRRIGQDVRR